MIHVVIVFQGINNNISRDILEVTFDSKMTFEKHLRSVSRAASQRLGILRKSWRVFHDRLLLRRCLRGFCPVRLGVVFCSVVLGVINAVLLYLCYVVLLMLGCRYKP